MLPRWMGLFVLFDPFQPHCSCQRLARRGLTVGAMISSAFVIRLLLCRYIYRHHIERWHCLVLIRRASPYGNLSGPCHLFFVFFCFSPSFSISLSFSLSQPLSSFLPLFLFS
ncbi:hypothetical protein GGI42DRAFT_94210 [Trichoderma sp. SZMC 28013]